MSVRSNDVNDLRGSNLRRRMSKSRRDDDDSDKENTYNPDSSKFMSLTSTPVCQQLKKKASPGFSCSGRKLFSPLKRRSQSSTNCKHSVSSDLHISQRSYIRKFNASVQSLTGSYRIDTSDVTSPRGELQYTCDTLSRTSHRRKMGERLCAEQSLVSDSNSMSYNCDVFADVSGISELSGFEVYDQASSNNLHENFHSTFSYPLHSTVCNDSLDISNDLVPNFAEQFVLRTPLGKAPVDRIPAAGINDLMQSGFDESSSNSVADMSDELSDESDSFCDSSYLSDDEISIDVDEYAAEYDSLRKRLQNNQRGSLRGDHLSESLSQPAMDISISLSKHAEIHDPWDDSDSSLSGVWYSPNNTIDGDYQVSTPSGHQFTTSQTRWRPAEWTGTLSVDTNKCTDSGEMRASSECTDIRLSEKSRTQHSDDTDSGCSSCECQSQNKQTVVCDNTGKSRTVIRQECSRCYSTSADSYGLSSE